MNIQKSRAATRLILTLAAAAGLSGCVAYGPPYPAYGAAAVGTTYYAGTAYDYGYGYPYSYGYGYGYGYGRPAWVGPPVALNFGYYNHSYRGGYRGYEHRGPYNRGPGWQGAPGGRGPGFHGAPGGRGSGPGVGGGRGGGGGWHGGGAGGGRGGGGGRGHR